MSYADVYLEVEKDILELRVLANTPSAGFWEMAKRVLNKVANATGIDSVSDARFETFRIINSGIRAQSRAFLVFFQLVRLDEICRESEGLRLFPTALEREAGSTKKHFELVKAMIVDFELEKGEAGLGPILAELLVIDSVVPRAEEPLHSTIRGLMSMHAVNNVSDKFAHVQELADDIGVRVYAYDKLQTNSRRMDSFGSK